MPVFADFLMHRIIAVAVLLLASYASYAIFCVIQKAYFSPLAKIPGPWHAHLTGIRLQLTTIAGKRCHWVHKLHQVYGPMVRIAPHEIAVCDPTACKEIHSVSSRFYKSDLPGPPVSNLFSMTDPKAHGFRRRLYQKLLAQNSVRREYEPAVSRLVQSTVQHIKADVEKDGVANVYNWWMLMANDVVCLLTLGDTPGLIETGGSVDEVLTARCLHLMFSWAQFSVPLFLIFRFLGSPLSRTLDDIFHVDRWLASYGDKAATKTRADEKLVEGGTFFARALREAPIDKTLVTNGKAQLSDSDIAMDAAGFQLAGSETVAITLTFLIWRVLSRPALQKQLEEEVASLGDDISDAACETLPLLNATIEETLRLHGAAPTALKRVVPDGGTTLCGYYIPAGELVATMAWSLHRNPDIWPDPDTSVYPYIL
jgi:averufin monooxygenase